MWSDEFNGNTLDTSKWKVEHSTYGDGGGTLQCYTPNNISLNGGDLVLTARTETVTCPNGSTRDYSSGMVRSQGKADWLYGRFEVRALLPAGKGMWPAAWLSPTTRTYGGWPASGELDIVELLGDDPDTIVGTVHWGASGDHNHHGAYGHSATPFTDGYHVYAVEWEPGEIRWYVDDVLYHTSTAANSGWYAPGTNSFGAPFDQAFYMKLNLAVGGNWPGSPDASTPFPAEYRIDYVRVYQ